MRIVPTGMHHTVSTRPVRRALRVGDAQCINVGSKRRSGAIILTRRLGQQPAPARRDSNRQTFLPEPLCKILRRSVFLAAGLRVFVQVPAQRTPSSGVRVDVRIDLIPPRPHARSSKLLE
jgi:hypothetical protein